MQKPGIDRLQERHSERNAAEKRSIHAADIALQSPSKPSWNATITKHSLIGHVQGKACRAGQGRGATFLSTSSSNYLPPPPHTHTLPRVPHLGGWCARDGCNDAECRHRHAGHAQLESDHSIVTGLQAEGGVLPSYAHDMPTLGRPAHAQYSMECVG